MALQTFYLGTHICSWLSLDRCRGVPLFVSRRTLSQRKTLPRAVTRWSLDSGGFTELQMYGRWTVSPEEYVVDVRRYLEEVGMLDWAAPMDWMCEPPVIHGLVERRKKKPCPECRKAKRTVLGTTPSMRVVALDEEEAPTFVCPHCDHTMVGAKPRIHVGRWRAWAVQAGPTLRESVATADRLGVNAVVVFHGTGLSVEEHQARTVANFLELRRLAPDLQIIPVLQGWRPHHYWRCVELYEEAGVNLRAEPTVGVGTVCRRQGTAEATVIMRTLADMGLRLHGFGFKVLGLRESADDLQSADSLAWSETARRAPPLPGHDQPGPGRPKGHINCANCLDYALMWREELLESLRTRKRRPSQMGLFPEAA